MRHIFVVNPAAGKKRRALALIPEIDAYFSKNPGQYEIYVTKGPRDAIEYVRARAAEGGAVRFYACGGDGTLMEVLSGIHQHTQCEIACIPCGSANDYIRSFGNTPSFRSIEAQVTGKAQAVDAIDCNGRLSLNIACIGLDADVADKMAHFKHLPLVSGPMAYNLAVLYILLRPIGRHLDVHIDTETGTARQQGSYLFALAASGQYYGGGYRGAPQASPDDKQLDFVLVEKVGRLKILSLLKRYKTGNHLELPIVHTFRGNKMQVTYPQPINVCLDGECFRDSQVVFTLLPGAVRFVRPASLG